jgi:hypothetical protein
MNTLKKFLRWTVIILASIITLYVLLIVSVLIYWLLWLLGATI